MRLLAYLQKRRTIRKYKQKKIPRKIILEILEAGRLAPSAHNSQPWHFIVVTDSKLKKQITSILIRNSSKFLSSVNILLKKSIETMMNAPCLIFIYNTRIFSKKIGFLGKPYTSVAELSEIQSIAAAIQNMHLAASSMSMGFAWLIFPSLLEKEINKILKAKDSLIAIATVGYPDERPKITTRKNLKDITTFK